jgi:hypothetical protein
MTSTIQHPFFTMKAKTDTSKTYGRGKLRINLNSPRGNITEVWSVASNLMMQLNYTEEKQSEIFASLEKDTYEECLKAFGDHKVFGTLFKLYYSPEYMLDWDDDEWGNPNEEDDDEREEWEDE